MSAVDHHIGYHLKRVYMLVQADFRAALGPEGMAPRVYSALALIVAEPGVSQSSLAKMLGVERSGVVSLVDELERRGYVAREPVAGDRRVFALRATDAGRAACDEATARIKAHEAALFDMLTEAEQAQMLDMLRRIRAAREG